MSGAIPPFPNTSSWCCAQEHLYLLRPHVRVMSIPNENGKRSQHYKHASHKRELYFPFVQKAKDQQQQQQNLYCGVSKLSADLHSTPIVPVQFSDLWQSGGRTRSEKSIQESKLLGTWYSGSIVILAISEWELHRTIPYRYIDFMTCITCKIHARIHKQGTTRGNKSDMKVIYCAVYCTSIAPITWAHEWAP